MYAPGFRYSPLYHKRDENGRRVWDGKVRAVDRRLSFDTGFLPHVVELLKSVELDDRRQIKQLHVHRVDHDLRDYQVNAIMAGLTNTFQGMWWPRGVLQVPTGGGKTRMAAVLIRITGCPRTIFIVPSADLVKQTRDEFAEQGVETGTIHESALEGDPRVVVTTIQSLMWWSMGDFAKPEPDEDPATFAERAQRRYLELSERRTRGEPLQRYLATVEQAFLDEAHMVAANDANKGNLFVLATQLMPNAYMRWGLSGTPFMRDQYHNWLLEGAAGLLLYRISTKSLIDGGILAKAKITMVRCKPLVMPETWDTATKLGIVENEERNRKIVEILKAAGGRAVALVQEIEHGNRLVEMCRAEKLRVEFISGPVATSKRKALWDKLVRRKLDAIIASRIGDQGLNIPAIETLVLAGGGKSKVKTIQRLGRGLRRTDTKSEVSVWDFIDVATPHLYRHSMARRKTYIDEGHDVTECEL